MQATSKMQNLKRRKRCGKEGYFAEWKMWNEFIDRYFTPKVV